MRTYIVCLFEWLVVLKQIRSEMSLKLEAVSGYQKTEGHCFAKQASKLKVEGYHKSPGKRQNSFQR